jgi:SAM-dependent methyltransferase
MTDPKRIVEEGYDRIAERHLAWAQRTRSEERERYARLLLGLLPEGATVLELGCGAGLPSTRQLAQRLRVTGVDISPRQLELARVNVPDATYIQGDMCRLDLPPESFDAVAAFYSIIHVPQHEQSRLLRNVAGWLRPDGILIASLSARRTDAGYEEDWLGAPMFWSGFDAATNRGLVEEAGLHIELERIETADEDGTPVSFLWVVARKAHSPESEFA